MNGNILINNENSKIFLSTELHGKLIADIVYRGIVKNRRSWEDPSKFTHLMYFEMINGSTAYKGKNFRISTEIENNDTWIIGVDPRQQKVVFFYESGSVFRTFDFDTYCSISSSTLKNVDNFSYGYNHAGDSSIRVPIFDFKKSSVMFDHNSTDGL